MLASSFIQRIRFRRGASFYAAALSAAAVGVVGCSTGSDRPSKEQIIAEGDRICERVNRQIVDLDEPQTPSEFAAFIETGAEMARRSQRELRGLRPPDDGREHFEEFLDANDAALELVPKLLPAVKAAERGNERPMLQVLARVERLEERGTQAAARYGFKECSKKAEDL